MKTIIAERRSKSTCAPCVTRVYRTTADRRRAITQLKRRFNYFVTFLSSTPGREGHALQCGVAEWVGPNRAYVD